jgi:hypothetical protein
MMILSFGETGKNFDKRFIITHGANETMEQPKKAVRLTEHAKAAG